MKGINFLKVQNDETKEKLDVLVPTPGSRVALLF
jgi:hypothetical protein